MSEKQKARDPSDKRLKCVDRDRQALELRLRGYKYHEIAVALEYSSQAAAWKAVQRCIKETIREPAEEVRRMELGRLDELLKGIWPEAVAGDTKAIEAALKILDRRSKYLGLDAPVQTDTRLEVEYVNDWRNVPMVPGLE